ncbi:MAG TPA: phosphate ABC transporter substrate-binding protein PstS [Ilumatobacteraceae bacterium]|nr:phosphate ABC transporter substrate-binding protein PstS [Ilumatobacteraceae bacterium]
MNSPKRRIFAGAFALTLVAAACGSDEDTSSSTDAPDTTEAAGTTEAMAETTEAMAETTDGGEAMAEVAGTLVGAGASSQASAMQGWQAGFQALNPGATVEYDPVGSGGGREQFLAGGTDFAGSDSALDEEEFASSVDRCAGDQGAINLPHYISPIAIPYNLPSLEGETLNLSPEVIAGIFANEITAWNDPAIAADNPDLELPDTTINPVHRSDESGTTKNFTDYMSQAAADVWTFGAIEAWDADGPGGGEGAPQTSGVVSAVSAGEGSIGYADASQIGDLPAAAVGVAGEFVEFSPEAAAKIVDSSERVPGESGLDYTIVVNRNPDSADVYPIALVSYHIVCVQYDSQEKVDLVRAFMAYVGSTEGQAAAAEAAGSAPLSAEVQAEVQKSVEQISVAS